METVQLGRTGLTVSRVCLGAGGTSRLGRKQGRSDADIIALVRTALDLGVTLFDTAPNYGTEDILGAALQGRRDAIVLSSKVRCTRDGKPFESTDYCSPADIRRSVERSLALLRTDRLDILHFHGVRPHQYAYCVEELLPELKALRDEGKIRFFGLTESFGNDRDHAVAEQAVRDGHFDVLMLGFNMVNPSLARTVLPLAKAAGVGTMCMYAVRGALARKDAARRLVETLVAAGEVDAAGVDAEDPLGFLLEDGVAASLTEAAYRYCRHADGIDVVMTGTGSAEHLRENVAAILGPPLPGPVLDRLAAAFGRVTSATGDLVP